VSVFGSVTLKWEDAQKSENIMWRVPRNIRLNDNIVVREDEIAVFLRDGKALAYIDRPDRYALTSINAPIVGAIVKFLSGVEQQAEVYYLQKRPFDGKFGSKQPYQFKDKEFGMVNLRLFGEMRYRVKDPENFINEFVGTRGFQSSGEVEDRIQEQIVLLIYDAIGHMKEKGMGVTDLASNLMNVEQIVLEKSKPHFDQYGVLIDKISGLYISLPEEVQKAVDTRASMQVLGTDYVGYQTGQAMREAASSEGGGGPAGAGVGVGAGIGMGYMMMDATKQRQQGAPAPGMTCAKCGQMVPGGMKFCGNCGARMEPGADCPSCGKFVPEDSKFCPECGKPTQSTEKCEKCGEDIPADTKFCPECGEKVGE
jgi:membrane protease subunit (stomatin/prohibitin family)